jgi:hypothetical protein
MSDYQLPASIVAEFADLARRLATQERGVLAPHCELRRTANQTIPTGAQTSVVQQSVIEDTTSMFDAANGRIRINTAGIYIATFSAYWVDAAAGRRFGFLMRNGSTIARESRVPNGDNPQAAVTAVRRYAAGDFIQGAVYQNSGANLDIVNDVGNASVILTATYIGR